MLQEVRVWKQKMPKGISVKWIKSHQLNPTTRASRLNRVADNLASEQHQVVTPWKTESIGEMLPQTQAQLITRGVRYTTTLDKTFQYKHYEGDAKGYISRKLGLTGKEHMVNWEISAGSTNR